MEAGPSKKKKAMMKETTKSLPPAELKALPIEVLVKIFNFLPNHDIRCGVSLVCKKFYEICQDQSLVPVKDLCIYGTPVEWESEREESEVGRQEGKKRYMIELYDVLKIISKSKHLTSLKIKALNSEAVNELVSKAFRACPKLTHLEIIETPNEIGQYFLM